MLQLKEKVIEILESTKFVVVTGGKESNLVALVRSEQLKLLFPSALNLVAIKFELDEESSPVSFTYNLIEQKWINPHKEMIPENERKFKLSKIYEIKRQIYEVTRIRNPDYIILEIPNNLKDQLTLDIIEAVKEMEEEIGKENFLFVHIENTPHLKPEEQEKEKIKGLEFLSATGIKPNLLIKEHEITWVH